MNPHCPRCLSIGSQVSRHGNYYRRSDSRRIERFRCKQCKRSFSRATGSHNFNQKKRRINTPLLRLLAACVSLRECSRLLNVSRSTVDRRLAYLGARARDEENRLLEKYSCGVKCVQVDDLITLEHTKCKPLSVCAIACKNDRLILDFGVAAIPASGHLAAISRKKYGKRKDESRTMRKQLFQRLTAWIDENAHFESDGHDQYAYLIKRMFPKATHCIHPSLKGCVTGQGEMKKAIYDPLYTINHTLAMLRANINRLVRRSWCTTKKPENLTWHLYIYRHRHNQRIRSRLSA